MARHAVSNDDRAAVPFGEPVGGRSGTLFTLPTYQGYNAVDLGDPNFRPQLRRPAVPTELPASYPTRPQDPRISRRSGTGWMDRFGLPVGQRDSGTCHPPAG
jgi:hypothetical protein